jgi:hypothetical protein
MKFSIAITGIFVALGLGIAAAMAQQAPSPDRRPSAEEILATLDCGKVLPEQRAQCEYKRKIAAECRNALDVLSCMRSKM